MDIVGRSRIPKNAGKRSLTKRTVPSTNPAHVSGWPENRRTEKLAEKVARQIVDDIFEAGQQPGSMLLAEGAMLLRYQVGRGTLREALRVLEVQGLITMKPGPGGGPVLRALTTADFARMARLHLHILGSTYGEVLHARLALEPMMARLAAQAKDKRGLRSLRDAIGQADAVDVEDEAAWRAVCHLFHVTIASISGNSVLNLLGTSLREVYGGRTRPLRTPTAARTRVLAVHHAIATAILHGNGAVAERLMREHMEEFARQGDRHHACGLHARITWR